jgi:hypothetical protein
MQFMESLPTPPPTSEIWMIMLGVRPLFPDFEVVVAAVVLTADGERLRIERDGQGQQ